MLYIISYFSHLSRVFYKKIRIFSYFFIFEAKKILFGSAPAANAAIAIKGVSGIGQMIGKMIVKLAVKVSASVIMYHA